MGPLEGIQDVLGVSQSMATTRAKDWGAVISCLAAAAAKLLQSCPTLCDPIDGSPPGSDVPGILQAGTLEWVCHFLLQCMKVKSQSEVAQLCPTLHEPMDCSLPVSSVHGIFQARVLEWVALPSPQRSLVLPFYDNYSSSPVHPSKLKRSIWTKYPQAKDKK